jgi:hypothetical protein
MVDRDDESRAHGAPGGSIPGLGDGGLETECVEWCPICRTMDVLRASTSPEVREQWHGIQREALLTLRALIDHYVERLGEEPTAADSPAEPGERPQEPRRATPVEEIPPVE